MTDRKLHLGIAGLGRAFTLMRPAFKAAPEIEVVAAADPRPEARNRFIAEFNGHTYDSVDGLVRDATVDVVYIATPHQFHAAQAIAATQAGKHLLIEKPMALTLAEAAAMVEAASKARVKLIVGHSHSFDAPIAVARKIIASGEFGALRMVSALNFTDFLYRPRRPEELRTDEGGGVIFNQAAHQVDIVRLLAGGLTESVYAQTGIWDPSRPTEGAYSAMIRFAGGITATITYSGYAHFDSDEFVDGLSEMGAPKNPDSFLHTRRALPPSTDAAAEEELRRRRGYGVAANPATDTRARWYEHFGLVIASCEHADLRPTPKGVLVYSDTKRELIPLPMPTTPRLEVVQELCNAVLNDVAPVHSGEWGLATLEASLAILQSSRERREIKLHRQIATL